MLLVALTILKILAVLKTKFATANEQQRIVTRQVERAGGRAEERGVVEHVALTAGLRRRLQSASKAPEFVVDEATIDAEVFVAVGLLRFVRQVMSGLEANARAR